ncbi:LacI family transcriptional regulator [Exilibacterium tricleocarpae]|uniref:LacI family transcriptional regulator n=1 Tax=Exilibacterium tricleocarpae TaxID=2591008 RepID=A0A545TM07_9GAMM|nr:LacI family DNA-binding transcriptional regulator [Exilibacterium tricleocarpae]TQV78181.1 LacI family transcriptional regulator [Exilibacterium tricleocarpae]
MTSTTDKHPLDRPATITDVAENAGVSMKTVSRVLNRAPNVKPATRARVEAAMQTLGYRPNSPARMLASNQTYLIGLIYNASSSYITSIQNGVLSACRPEHYDLLIHPCSYDSPSLLDNIGDFIASKRVDGLVLVPPVSDVAGIRELLIEHGVVNVAISHEPEDETDWAVCTNDREICKNMVRHLSRLGHQRIAFVRSHPDHKAMADRYLGYLDGMAEVKLKVNDALVVQGENTFESGIDCGVQLLRQRPRPTAIFCANDHMATGVMKVAHERRLQIPGDVSIAGFDDIPVAKQVWPQLTTVRQPLEAMAKLAAEELIRLVRNEKPQELRVVVDAELIIRQSTGPALVDPD